MRKDAPLAVELPSADRDRPSWVKVGVIAAVGFVIGVAWPRVMGVKIGPSAPGEAAAAAAAASGSAKAAAEVPPASVTQKASAAAAPSAAPAASTASAGGPPTINVQKGAVIGCKGEDGESKKGKECGGVASLDQIVAPRLKKLSTCGAADGQSGKLSFMVNADFASGRFGWDVGKSSTVGNVEGLTTCLKTIFQGVVLSGVAHENPKYTVAYTANFTAPVADEKPAAPADAKDPKKDDKAETPPAAGGEASVSWDVALVRDVPKTGTVVARLPRGAKVKLGAVKDGWYAVKYGDAFSSDGFVYHSALGR